MVSSLFHEPMVIPAGTPVHSMGTGRWHVSKRSQTVHPFDVREYDCWKVITWPGTGGYWRRVVLRDGRYVDYWPGYGDHDHRPLFANAKDSPARPTWAELEGRKT